MVPLPSVLGLALTGAGFVSLVILHGNAFYVGGAWMVFGLVSYFVYRRLVEGYSLTDRVTVPEQALRKQLPDVELASVLVPVFGEGLDDEIVGTAGRLADSDPLPGQSKPRLELFYVIDLPLDGAARGPDAARSHRPSREGPRPRARGRRGVPVGRGRLELREGAQRR